MQHVNLPAALFFAGLGFVFTTSTAHAYIDPGTASLVLQGIVGAIGAGIVTMGIYRRKIMGFFRRDGTEESDSASDSSSADKESN